MRRYRLLAVLLAILGLQGGIVSGQQVAFWLTNADQRVLFQRQPPLNFLSGAAVQPAVTVDSSVTYQSMDGFGYCLTGGSAQLIEGLPGTKRSALLKELFSKEGRNIGVTYLRLTIGSSDMSARVFSYDDDGSPAEPDTLLLHFTLADDNIYLVPLLREITAINPSIQILASPWSPPSWMKSNDRSAGGSLLPKYYSVYAQYFVRYVHAMAAKGIRIDAVTPQNEPLNPNNNPSCVMTDTMEDVFVRDYLGPAFLSAGLRTRILVFDHNCDRPDYPEYILADPAAAKYVDGSAFHLYAGDISALTTVHDAYPAKNIYFTEQYVGAPGHFGPDLDWAIKNLIIGAPRNWSRNVLEWNLAADQHYGPHTPGGCTTCLGALTVEGSSVSRNTSYYIIAHASKFVLPGSLRIASTVPGNLQNVAFLRPDGKKVLIVLNDQGKEQRFAVQSGQRWFSTSLAGGAVGTFVW